MNVVPVSSPSELVFNGWMDGMGRDYFEEREGGAIYRSGLRRERERGLLFRFGGRGKEVMNVHIVIRRRFRS